MQRLQLVASRPEEELAASGDALARGITIMSSAVDYWIQQNSRFPSLGPIALDLISAPASQAYTERIFSVCGDLTAGKRNRTAGALERRVFLKCNMKYL